jgi:quinoprotein glucose dehydrogenase
MPGEWVSPTQPFPTNPAPIARPSFTEADINPFLNDTEQAAVREVLRKSRNEGLFTPPSLQGSISIPGHNGGANFGSVAVDPNKGLLYVVAKTLPVVNTLVPPEPDSKDAKGDYVRYTSPPNFIQQPSKQLAIGPPWSTLTAYDLNTGNIKWQAPHGEMLGFEGKATGAINPRGGPIVTATGLVFSATSTDHKVRAYDGDTGKVLWMQDLGNGSEGVPAVYQVNNREFLVLPVANYSSTTGPLPLDHGAGTVNGYVAFALPAK